MTNESTLSIEREGEVDWLTLNRPDRLNAISEQMLDELHAYFSALPDDPACRVVILRGAGRAFCAGLDLKEFDPLAKPAEKPASLQGLILAMRACPQPIIALVRGAACGGGLSLVLASDVRLAAPSAKMNVAYVKLGLSGCELGTSFYLPREVGSSVANELMLTGRFILADRALATGLVSAVVPDDALDQAGRELAMEMLAGSRIGLRRTKETIARVARVHDLAEAIRIEDATQQECMHDPSFAERVGAFGRRG